MRFSREFTDRLKTHDRVPNVLQSLLQGFKRNGRADSYVACVPWREDNHPSLHVFRLSGIWWFKDMAYHDDKGDVIALVRRLQSLDFLAAVEWLASKLGERLPEKTSSVPRAKLAEPSKRLKALQRIFELAIPLDDGTAAANYLAERGLLDSARQLNVRCYEAGESNAILTGAEELGLWTPAGWVYKKLPFIVYPAKIGEVFHAHRFRLLLSQKEALDVGMKATHWQPSSQGGLTLPTTWPTLPQQFNPTSALILTEGETDCLAVRTLVENSKSYAVLGTSRFGQSTPEFEQLVKARVPIILAFQRDRASAKAAKRLAGLFTANGLAVKVLVPLGGSKDWAELLKTGQEQVSNIDDISVPLGDYSMSRVFDEVVRKCDDLESGKLKFVVLPWPTVQWAHGGKGLRPGTVGLLSSRTGAGKSLAVYQLALQATGLNLSCADCSAFIVNTEMALEGIGERLLALAEGNSKAAGSGDTQLIRELLAKHQSKLDNLPLDITPPEPRSTDDVLDLLREKSRTHRLLVVDHIGDLTYRGKSWEALPAFTGSVCNIARQSGAVVILVTHLNADPTADILSYSKKIENICDFSWSIRAFEEQQAVVDTASGKSTIPINRMWIIRKNRHGRSNVRIAMTLDTQTLALRDQGRLVKFTKNKLLNRT